MKINKLTSKAIFLILCVLLISYSCKKDLFKNELSGFVKEAGTGQRLAGVEVVLFSSCFGRNLNQPGSCPKGDKKLYKTTTDATGYYCIRYDKYRNNEKYFVAYNDGKHFLAEYAIPDKPKNKLEHDQNLIAPAEIKLHIKNVNPFDGNDVFFLPYSFFKFGYPENDIYLKGTQIDTVLGPYPVDGHKDINTNWVYTKNGVQNRITLIINATGFQVTTIDVNY